MRHWFSLGGILENVGAKEKEDGMEEQDSEDVDKEVRMEQHKIMTIMQESDLDELQKKLDDQDSKEAEEERRRLSRAKRNKKANNVESEADIVANSSMAQATCTFLTKKERSRNKTTQNKFLRNSFRSGWSIMREERILGNSKPCPKCKRPMEKNQGCTHMTCTPPCKFEVCCIFCAYIGYASVLSQTMVKGLVVSMLAIVTRLLNKECMMRLKGEEKFQRIPCRDILIIMSDGPVINLLRSLVTHSANLSHSLSS
ncbi:hypothetical protein L6164_000694 [Bauhinia variegata]|uniref:Uncharacterized protein n=1 Tax=Bauhinia variegata TaxID=167791 RepID=A0ACB9Q7E6_BAUVA|nr:hypothetical protein L6164_000694 [Bauhinia variegata]